MFSDKARARNSRQRRILILSVSLAAGIVGACFVIVACSVQGLNCINGLTHCGQFCADLTSDPRNCGSCGVGCQIGQVCKNSACQCEPGTTFCNGTCTVTSSDPLNCGGCSGDGGVRCDGGQVCDHGQCMSVPCTLDLCGSAQSCARGSCSYDVVVACSNQAVVGLLAGLDGGLDLLGPTVPIGSVPRALGAFPDFPSHFAMVAVSPPDGGAGQLLQLRMSDSTILPQDAGLDASPNQLWIEKPYAYVVDSAGNSLRIIRRVDGGLLDQPGYISFSPDLAPQAIAKVGNLLYVPLRGGAPDAGPKVAEVDVSDAGQPVRRRTFDLSQLILDGGLAATKASAVTAWGDGGTLYVALNNPLPPGRLAKINLEDGGLSTVGLGDFCLSAGWVVATSEALYTSCAGNTLYDDAGVPIATQGSAMVAVNSQDQSFPAWIPTCPASGSDAGCAIALGRFAVFRNRFYVGDQLAGGLFVLEKTGGGLDAGLVERRGYSTDGGPIPACPADAGLSSVLDVISVP